MSIYKACDIRGVAGVDLTPDLYRRLGRALGAMVGQGRTVAVGGDVRTSTRSLAASLVLGLCEKGVRVTWLGTVPTPLVYFAQKHLGLDACAIVTASHNPPEYNGLKFMLGDLPVLPDDIRKLRDLAEGVDGQEPETPQLGHVDTVDLSVAYSKWVVETADALAGVPESPSMLKVVVDAGNGAHSEIAPHVLRGLSGVSVTPLFCKPDGTFPNRDPNSAVAENLTALRVKVRDTGADLGVAFDGDGDRVTFVDERGGVLGPDETTVLLMHGLADRMEGRAFIYDLKCSQVVAREAEALGATPIMEKAGHAFIKRRMISEGAFLGGEISGHYFHETLHGGDDGLFTAIVMIRLLQARAGSLADWCSIVPPRHITPDIRLDFETREIPALLEKVRGAFPEDMRSELDGIRIAMPKGWALLRASITEPKITLRFEGDSAADLDDVIATFLRAAPELTDAVYKAVKGGGR